MLDLGLLTAKAVARVSNPREQSFTGMQLDVAAAKRAAGEIAVGKADLEHVVAARLAGTAGTDGIAFFTVDGDAAGLTRTALATMDQTRKQARLEFAGVRAAPLGEPGAGWPARSTTTRSLESVR